MVWRSVSCRRTWSFALFRRRRAKLASPRRWDCHFSRSSPNTSSSARKGFCPQVQRIRRIRPDCRTHRTFGGVIGPIGRRRSAVIEVVHENFVLSVSGLQFSPSPGRPSKDGVAHNVLVGPGCFGVRNMRIGFQKDFCACLTRLSIIREAFISNLGSGWAASSTPTRSPSRWEVSRSMAVTISSGLSPVTSTAITS